MGPVAFGYPPESTPLDSVGSMGVLEALIGVDKSGEPTPLLATAWTLSDDGLSVVFELRKGVKFHDNTDFNAASVKWNMDENIKTRRITTVSSVDIVDDYKVKFNLPQFNNAVYTQISDIPYVSRASVEKNGVDWAKANAVGTGPFKQKSFTRDVSVVKVRFDNYWNKDMPYTDGITHIFIPDATTAMMSFQSGEGNVLVIGSDGKEAKDLAAKGYVVRGFPGMANFLSTDSNNPESPFSKIQVRQALEYAIDKKTITAALGFGFMDAINQLAPAGFVGKNPNIADRPYDPAKAKQLLAAAGYPQGFKTKLMAIQAFTNPESVTAIQTNLNQVGITTEIDLMDIGRGMGTLMGGWKNGMMIAGTGLDPNLCQRLSADLGVKSPMSPSLKRPDQWQPTLDKAMAARDVQTRDKYLQDLMKVAVDDMFVVPLWTTYDLAAMYKTINSDMLINHHIKWNPASAWIGE